MEIAARLRQLGFPSNYVGFPYLACAISLVQTEPEYLYQVFKCLYPPLPQRFKPRQPVWSGTYAPCSAHTGAPAASHYCQAISPRPLTARPTVSELIALLSGYFQDVGDL